MASVLASSLCSFEDYAYNITNIIIGAEEVDWDACIETMPHHLAQPYLNWLDGSVVAFNFKPYPRRLTFFGEGHDSIKAKANALAPRYIKLVAKIRQKFSEGLR